MKLNDFSFHPRLIDTLRDYDRARFVRDVLAGITVALVALPLAMAFAIASGAKPEAGIFTAIIAGFLISALGGSRVQIGGPAGAFIVVVYGIIEKYGLANLLICTIFAGILLFAMGMFRLGSLIRYIPVPIVIGFTNAIAVLIALSQMKEVFGLKITAMPADFFAQLKVLAAHAHTVDVKTCVLSLISLVIIFAWSAYFQRSATIISSPHSGKIFKIFGAVPGAVIVLVIGTVAVGAFGLQVETIGTRFGGIPQALPAFTLPDFSWALVKQLFPPTLTIALLSAIESLLCARVADGIIGDRHDPNQELMAQGVANFIVPFFGGIPATGTIARTVTNIRSGAASPIAGIIHAVVLLIIVLAAAPLAKNVPLASLAAILLFVAYNMGEWHEFIRLKHFPAHYRILLMATFLLTVIIDLTVAVEVGLVLACLFFIYRISSLTRIEPIITDKSGQALPDGVAAYSIFGSLFFGAVDKVEQLINVGNMPRTAMILELHQLIKLDETGLEALENVFKVLRHEHACLILCGATAQPQSLMKNAGFLDLIGQKNCVADLEAGISRARQLVAQNAE